MEKPRYLRKGDKIAIVATARKVSLAELQPAIEVFNNWGFEVILGKNLLNEDDQFSGTTTQRVQDLQQALDDNTIKAIFCARGGYGTVKIIDGLDFSEFQKHPKWIVGYSDVTVLHNHINQNFNIQTLHATMPINFSTNSVESLQSLKNALFGEKLSYQFDTHLLNRKGEAAGELVGGNLSIIYSLTGSVSQLDTKNKILFIEDLDEYLYHIDRMMMNLKRVGMLKNLSGLIVGGMTAMKDNTIPYGKTAEEIILDAVKEYDYPVCFGFEAGHISTNLALKMGATVKLKVAEICTLKFEV
ncbi:MAG: LD-carboxypeptidase [Flavobacteriales bacterium CG_4_10_14_0_2_um_filter_32_8]|nr:MAG: LD-carboxypeptidase [Flavobacteriales bacterium CG_4_10_14_0_2_um_filter_32_8]